jgi:DNA repair exonuclease SbcCD ATPase subunit
MASNTTSVATEQAIKDLQSRLDWLDEERRKQTRKVTELEQKLTLQEREIAGREQRIQDLERQLSSTTAQLGRIPKIDIQLAQFKDEIVQLIEQYDQRRIQSEAEMDRLRRVEHEGSTRELAELRKEIGFVPKLQNDMELRVAEESRLANLIGQQKTQTDSLKNRLENWDSNFAFLEEKEKHNNRNITEVQTAVVEINKRWEHIYSRLDTSNSAILRLESSLQGITEKQNQVQESTKNWMEQIQIGEYERNQRLEGWRRVLEDQEDNIERFNKEFIKFSDMYKEAKMAVQTLSGWQVEIEKQQREASEILRVETSRMQSRWDDFRHENDKRWKSQGVDAEQRWNTVNRHEREIREMINLIEDKIGKLEQEKELLWRVQTAQSDALKQFPRLWLEEVEKAISQNPNRRRQPALVPVREEFD